MQDALRFLKNRLDTLDRLADSLVQVDLMGGSHGDVHAAAEDTREAIAVLEEELRARAAKAQRKPSRKKGAAAQPKKRGRPRKQTTLDDAIQSLDAQVAKQQAETPPPPLPIGAHPLERLAGRTLPPASTLEGGAS